MTASRILTLIIIMFFAVPVHAHAEEALPCYMADVLGVVDGDTIRIDGRVWPGMYAKTKVRFFGINAPEPREPGGLVARAYLESIIGERVSLCRVHTGKYGGRVIADVFTPDGIDIADALVEAGHAKRVGKR